MHLAPLTTLLLLSSALATPTPVRHNDANGNGSAARRSINGDSDGPLPDLSCGGPGGQEACPTPAADNWCGVDVSAADCLANEVEEYGPDIARRQGDDVYAQVSPTCGSPDNPCPADPVNLSDPGACDPTVSVEECNAFAGAEAEANYYSSGQALKDDPGMLSGN